MVTFLYSRNLTEHCKPAIKEKKNHYKKGKNKQMRPNQNKIFCVGEETINLKKAAY